MKKWENPEFKVLDLAKTAFGKMYPEEPDSELTPTIKPDGSEGWVRRFGLVSGLSDEKQV